MSKTDSLINELVDEATARGFSLACDLMRIHAKRREHEDTILDCLCKVRNEYPEYARPDTSKDEEPKQ